MNNQKPQTEDNKLFGRTPYKYIFIGMWVMAILGLIVLAGIFYYVADNKMPDTSELEHPQFEESTIVYADDGVELDRYFRINRQWVNYDSVSQNVVNALLATEDHRFYDHSGIDAKGTARAILFLGSRGGASTITQQLALQFFTEKRSSRFLKRVWQKFKEWVIAVEFERRYTKEEIIGMYLNKFDFNYQAIGIGSAAKIYFDKDQKELTVPEAATLIGMLKNPTYYNPVKHADRTLSRRNVVLKQMNKNKFINDEEYRTLIAAELDVSDFSRGANYKGLASHFMAELKKKLKKLFIDEGLSKPGGAPFDLDVDGLKIYSTIDSRMQEHAETAALQHMADQQKLFENEWGNTDPWKYIEDRQDYSDDQIKRILNSREQKITNLIESTDLYKKKRYEHLDEIIKEIKVDIPEARLYGGDISRLLKAEKDAKYLSQLQSKKYISGDQLKVYKSILASNKYDLLKKKYLEMKADIRQTVNRKRPTKVYTHTGAKNVEMSIIDSIKYMSSFLQIGSISMDPQTGYVKTWVGGTNYDLWKYDHVTSNRQVGSTFKPFVYTAAIKNAISPCWPVKDIQYVIAAKEAPFFLEKSWSPKNTRGEFSGEEVTLKDALKKSLNSASVYIVKELGSIKPIIETAEDMGIKKDKIPHYPSIALGSPTLSVMEMTNAYATFANDGIRVKPILIKRIEYEGQVIYEDQPQQHRALSAKDNHAMVDMLKYAGSFIAPKIKSEYGGKTGTTNDHIDGWFMGITPDLVTGTWVGGDDTWIRYRRIENGQGGRMARPYFVNFMNRIENDDRLLIDVNKRFNVPDEVIVTDCSIYPTATKDTISVDLADEFDDIDMDE